MSTRSWLPVPAVTAVLAALAALALALAACGGSSESDRDSGDATVTGPGPAATSVGTPPPARTPIAGCPPGPSAPPATYYGFGLAQGDVVRTFNTRTGCENVVCEQSEVDGEGFWMVRIAGDNVCGVREGDEIVFTVNDEPATHTEHWLSLGVPADIANGITLER